MELVYMILIGITAGFLAGWLLKGKGFGWLINLILGIAGSLLGGWLMGKLGISIGNGLIGTLITATIGAVVLVLLVNLLMGKK